MKKLILTITVFFYLQATTHSQVGIGTTTPNPSAQLEVSSTTKGMLIPRMTQAERDLITPVLGLIIFNTGTNSFQYHNGSSWVNMAHSGIINGVPNKIPKFAGTWGLIPGLMTDNGAGIAINTNNAIPDASALLDMTSTTKGVLVPRMGFAQRNAIAAPATGLLIYQTDFFTGFYYYNGTVWTAVTSVGNSKWTDLNGNIYNNNAGNVGIGSSTPFEKLTVDGNAVTSGGIGIGTATPDLLNYKLDVNGNARTRVDHYVNRDLAVSRDLIVSQDLYLSRDLWVDRNFDVDGTSNFTGNITAYNNLNISGSITAVENVTASGNVTVDGGKGIIRNAQGSTQLKYYTRTVTFTAILGGHDLSPEGSFSFNGAAFTSTPKVMIGDIVSTGGTLGQLYRVQLIVYGCDDNSCKARLLNTSPNPVNYSITWNIICIGQ